MEPPHSSLCTLRRVFTDPPGFYKAQMAHAAAPFTPPQTPGETNGMGGVDLVRLACTGRLQENCPRLIRRWATEAFHAAARTLTQGVLREASSFGFLSGTLAGTLRGVGSPLVASARPIQPGRRLRHSHGDRQEVGVNLHGLGVVALHGGDRLSGELGVGGLVRIPLQVRDAARLRCCLSLVGFTFRATTARFPTVCQNRRH